MMMYLKKMTATLALVIASIPGYMQVPGAGEQPYIEVAGTAEQEVVPDEIYVAVEIRERKEKISLQQQEDRLKAIVAQLGLEMSDLSLSGALTDYVLLRRKSGALRSGKSYTVRVGDALTLGKLFRELDELEITDARIVRLDYSGMDSLQRQLRIKAIQAARDKATYLLQAIGQQPGHPLVVNEVRLPSPSGTGPYSALANVSVPGTETKWKQELEFEKMRVQAAVYIKFAIL